MYAIRFPLGAITVFNSDLEHGITPILRSAKNGRGVLFITKVAAFIAIAVFFTVHT
jgi:hypothetical protein